MSGIVTYSYQKIHKRDNFQFFEKLINLSGNEFYNKNLSNYRKTFSFHNDNNFQFLYDKLYFFKVYNCLKMVVDLRFTPSSISIDYTFLNAFLNIYYGISTFSFIA